MDQSIDRRLDGQIAKMRQSLTGTALEAARSRGQGRVGAAHVLYALYRDEGFTGRLLRGHGLESGEVRRLMGGIPNEPLKAGAEPVLDADVRHILESADDTLEVLRRIQADGQVTALLASHGIGKPKVQPDRAQVQAAACVGMALAAAFGHGADRRVCVDYLAYVRLQLEAAFDEERQ